MLTFVLSVVSGSSNAVISLPKTVEHRSAVPKTGCNLFCFIADS
jgi:hypothetical protein